MLEVGRSISLGFGKVEMPKISKILLVLRNDVDYVKTVDYVVKLAGSIAKPKIYVLYTVDVEPLPLHEKTEAEFYSKLREEGKGIVDNAIERLRNAGIHAELYDMYFGIASEKILKAEKELQPDLILLCARGLSTFKKLLSGSVSDVVLEKAEKPVVIIRPNGRI